MPGKQKRDGSKPLTRQQAKVAGNILRPHFDPSRGEKQFNEKTKRELVRAVNEKFAQDGQDAVYTVRKLEDWVSNGIYRWRKAGQRQLPPSWAKRQGEEEEAAAPAPRPATKKRERVLSNTTMKPLQKVGRGAAYPAPAPAEPLPSWPQHDPFGNDLAPGPPGPPPSAVAYGTMPPAAPSASEAMIRQRTVSERTMRMQAESALRAEAVHQEYVDAEIQSTLSQIHIQRSGSDRSIGADSAGSKVSRSSSMRSLGSFGNLAGLGMLPDPELDQLDLLPGFAPAGGEAGPDPDLGFGPPGAGFGGIGGGGGAEFVDEESGLSRLNSDDWTRDLVNALPPRQDESA